MVKKLRNGVLLACASWLLAACNGSGGNTGSASNARPLPLPTPGQQELVVLTTSGPLTYDNADPENITGFEYDLIQAFAAEHGLAVRYVVSSESEIPARLQRHEAHLAAAWQTPPATAKGETAPLRAGLIYGKTRDIIVHNEDTLPVDKLEKLAGRTVYALPGSRQLLALEKLRARIPQLNVQPYTKGGVMEMLAALNRKEIQIALVDTKLVDISTNYYPLLETGVELPEEQPIAWLFPANGNGELYDLAQDFMRRFAQDGTLARLQDRYFGHVERLKQADILKFITRMKTTLRQYKALFQDAQIATGLDWRLVAALSYQESQWEPLATSPTGVRGIMMLTEETADRLGVSNRLDPLESIRAGARYLGYLIDSLPNSIMEPDRTWMGLAAYNLGQGHFGAARSIAKQLHLDADSWYDMKKALPLLARPEYYLTLKSGKGRGGEAVVLTENVRMYYDILCRHEAGYSAMPNTADGMTGMIGQLGMQNGPRSTMVSPLSLKNNKARRSGPGRVQKSATPIKRPGSASRSSSHRPGKAEARSAR
jgi:membrane-bound lytic murein transglycosylase F